MLHDGKHSKWSHAFVDVVVLLVHEVTAAVKTESVDALNPVVCVYLRGVYWL